MRFIRDPKLVKATDLVKNGLKKDDPKDELILYYIEHLDELIDEQQKRIGKYRNFFETLNDLLPNHNHPLV